MAKQKSCFIIMPITTPEPWVDKYRDGKEHFKHVLECLFIPGVEQAGYKPIPPIAKGSDLIQANIISNLETAEIVLCDMSCLNPNVFFEFGIRTALNKPVCVVKDELTPKVPFDTAILNYQEYESSLEPWVIDAEIKKTSEHLQTSAERSKDVNTLWKYFGLKAEARAYEAEGGAESKLDYLALQIESMQEKIETLGSRRAASRDKVAPRFGVSVDQVLDLAHSYAPEMGRTSIRRQEDGTLVISYSGDVDPTKLRIIVRDALNIFGVPLELVRADPSSHTDRREERSF